jgi:hypothetical protein
MESKYLFEIEEDLYSHRIPDDEVWAASIKAACHRLRARVGSGKTMVRVEVKRIKD